MNTQQDFTQRTSTEDLYNLLNKLHVDNCIIIRKHQLKKILKEGVYNNIIMNLDDKNNGTHWTAIYVPKKIYFDSYAEEIPNEVPKDYKKASNNFEIQNIESTMCGSLCALWLHYMNYKTNKEFYNLFKDTYK